MRRQQQNHGALATVLVTVLIAASMAVLAAPPTPAAADANEAPGSPPAVRGLTAGGFHTCALVQGGAVKCWGDNAAGQLGQGDTASRGDGSGEMGADLIAVDLGAGRTATSLSAGNAHTCAILDDGSVKCWGYNGFGQLGISNNASRGDTANEMGDALPTVLLGTGRTATALAAGADFTCALLDDASVKCWGRGGSGQLGQSDNTNRGDQGNETGDNLPPVNLGAGRTATAITAGDAHACALLDNATIKCWGNNQYGQLGLGDTFHRGDNPNEMGDNLNPVSLGVGLTATQITAGGSHTCALLDNTWMKCWGRGNLGQLGNGEGTNRGDAPGEMGDFLPPIFTPPGRNGVAVSAGSSHTCAVFDDASVGCWGANGSGQLGQGHNTTWGDTANEMGPFLSVSNLGTGRTAGAVTLGGSHTCARLDNNTVKCWGENGAGQLGQGDSTDRGLAPNQMGDLLPTVTLVGTGLSGSISATGSTTKVSGALVALLDSADFSLLEGTVANGNGDFSVTANTGTYYVYLIDQSGLRTPGLVGSPTPVTILPGQTTAITASMVSVGGSVSGAIVEQGSNTPLAGASVIALNSTTGAPETATTANSNGQYVLPDLVAGNHFLAAMDPTGARRTTFHPASPTVPGATPVAITPGATTNADFVLPTQSTTATGAVISGNVDSSSGSNLAGIYVIALHATDFRLARVAVTNPVGNYTVNVSPGGYKLAFLDPTGRFNLSWYNGQPFDGLGSATTVTAPSVINPNLTTSTGTVSGVIRNEAAIGISRAWAVVLGPTGAVAKAAVTDSSGNYSVVGLPPANYRIAAVHPNSGTVEYFEDAPDYPSASLFAVAGGTTTTLDLFIGAP